MENGGLMDFEATNVGRCPKHKINVPNGFLTIFKYSGSWCHRCSSKAIYTNPKKQALEKIHQEQSMIIQHGKSYMSSFQHPQIVIIKRLVYHCFPHNHHTIHHIWEDKPAKPSSSSSCCLRPDVLAREQRYEDRAEKRRRLHPVEWPQPATPAATAPQPALAAPLEVRIFPVFLWGVLLNLGENPKSLTVGFFETWELVEIPWDIENYMKALNWEIYLQVQSGWSMILAEWIMIAFQVECHMKWWIRLKSMIAHPLPTI